MKGIILSSQNDVSFIWYRFKPELLSLKLIDEIRYFFDEYKEPLVEFNFSEGYNSEEHRSFGYHDNGEVYAIMICGSDSIDYIVLKAHPLFNEINEAVSEKFEFFQGEKST